MLGTLFSESILKKHWKIILLSAFLLAVLLRIPSIYAPIMDIDETQYGEFAIKLLHGGLPYLDAVGEKPPFLYYYYAGVFSVFGEYNYSAVQCLTISWVLGTIFLIFLIIRRLIGLRAGLLAAFMYAIFSTTHEPAFIASNGETLMTLPLVAGMYVLVRLLSHYSPKRLLPWIGIGFLFGLGFMFRQQAAMHMVPIALLLLYLGCKDSKASKQWVLHGGLTVVKGLACLVAFFLPLGIALLILYNTDPKALDAYFYWNWTFNQHYVTSGAANVFDLERISASLGATLLFFLPMLILSVLGIKRYIAIRKNKTIALPQTQSSFHSQEDLHWNQAQRIFLGYVCINLVLNTYVACLGWRLYAHYFIFILPSLVLLSIYGMEVLLQQVRAQQHGTRLFRFLQVITICLVIIALLPRINNDLSMDMLESVYPGAPKYTGIFKEQRLIADFIQQHTMPTDTIFVWGFSTTINAYAQRENGSRLSWTDFMVGMIPGIRYDTVTGDYLWDYRIDKTWDYFWEDMQTYKPVLFIDTSTAGFHWYDLFPIEKYSLAEKQNPKYDLQGFLNSNYTKISTIGECDIYKRTKEHLTIPYSVK